MGDIGRSIVGYMGKSIVGDMKEIVGVSRRHGINQ